jgi:hypothetical protein
VLGSTTGTPRECNAHNEKSLAPMMLKLGGIALFGGDTTKVRGGETRESNLMVYQSELDNWDRVVLARWPCRRALFKMFSSPEYLKVVPCKLSALEVVLTPVRGQIVIPDLRFVAGGLFLAIFLLVGWVHAAGLL